MSEQTRNEIIRLHLGGAAMRRIAKMLGVSRNSVKRVIAEHEAARAGHGIADREMPAKKIRRPSQLDAFDDAIKVILHNYEDITAVRLLEKLKKLGFEGQYTIVRERLNELRPRPPKEPVIRFETGPGAQGQMDYSPYTINFVAEGRRRVYAFSLVLGYSRRQYLRFVESQDFETTLREHVRAFQHLAGVPHAILYDNMKVVVMRYDGEEPVYNPRFLAFATHYQFRPWACRRRRPRTKGKVERPFDYIETNLLNARTFRSLEHLNQVAAQWLETIADVRNHRTTKRRPIDLWEEEREHLRQLPDHPYEVTEVVYRMVNAEGMVQWRANWYPVPWHLIGRLLPVKATEGELIVYDHLIEECARHDLFPRSVTGQRAPSNRRYPRPEGAQSDQALRERFRTLGERGIAFLEGLLNARRCGRSEAVKILSLLENWRREDLIAAITRAARFRAYSHPTIERILSAEASPLSALELLEQRSRDGLEDLVDGAGVEPRPTSDYQGLLEDDENPDAGHGDDQDHGEDAEPAPA